MKKQSTILSVMLLLLSLCMVSIRLHAQTAIGGITPDDSAILDVQSNTRGVLFPRMNISQRGNIMNPATGLMIFNTQTRCLEINVGTPSSPSWTNIKCACGAYVSPGVWKEFLCYNLGALGETTGADPFTPSVELNGDYYQWGRDTKAADGPADENTPNDSAPVGWSTTTAADGSWADAPSPKGLQDPCPEGFRVPSKSQLEGLFNNNTIVPTDATWSSGVNNYSSGNRFGSRLFLPAAGFRTSGSGQLFVRNSFGYYWSSTVSSSPNALGLYFRDGVTDNNNADRASGFPVRCIAE